jgi:hypothetical protein
LGAMGVKNRPDAAAPRNVFPARYLIKLGIFPVGVAAFLAFSAAFV